MPKVLYVIDTLMPSGAEKSLVQITENFKYYQPVFVHLYKGDFLRDDLEIKGIKVYSLNFAPSAKYKAVQAKLEEIYKLENPDVVHSTLFRSDLITRRLKSKYNIPLVSSFVNNSYNPLRFKGKSLITQAKLRLVQFYDTISSRKVDLFISNSETIKNTKAKSTMVDLKKVKVIYRGRDITKFEDLSSKNLELRKSMDLEDDLILLNVSRLIERKGQLDLINALPKLQKKFPSIKLLIAGHGTFESTLNERSKELDLGDSVQLLGRRNDVPQLLSMADVFVYPSYFEGLPGALIEAMFSGKIIVCSDIPENMECVNEDCAIIFKRGDVDDYVTKLTYALSNKRELKQLGENAKIMANDKFDIEKISWNYESTYDSLLKKH